jgi:DNA polymerase V
MIDAGVDDGDLLVIDKSLSYKSGALALCFVNEEFTLKGIKMEGNTI